MIVRTLKSANPVNLFELSRSSEIVSLADKVDHVIYDTTINAGCRDGLAPQAIRPFQSQAHYCLDGFGLAVVDGIEHLVSAGTLVATSIGRSIKFDARSDMRICTVLGMEAVADRLIVRSLDEIIGTDRDVFWGNGQSRRLLVNRDGLGFALCVTVGNANTDSPLQYRNHFESCYYISGSGEYVWEGGRHPIDTNGGLATVFVMDRNDAHRMVVRDQSICLSVFSPAIEGHEAHDLTGELASSY